MFIVNKKQKHGSIAEYEALDNTWSDIDVGQLNVAVCFAMRRSAGSSNDSNTTEIMGQLLANIKYRCIVLLKQHTSVIKVHNVSNYKPLITIQ